MRNERLKWLVLSAIFAAVTAVFSQITIPLPLIPITGQTLAVGFTATILGSRWGTVAILIYVLLGAVGLPVFSGASGGPQVLVDKMAVTFLALFLRLLPLVSFSKKRVLPLHGLWSPILSA